MDESAIEEAAGAHTDLNIFEAIGILLEGSLLTAACDADADRIRNICSAAQAKALRRYDAALARCAALQQSTAKTNP